jgi:pyruvate ferredoxin oxidoreductase gamma subunit
MTGSLEIRFHGRGGQGVVTSAELLAVAAFRDGRHAQAFPSFGSERTGAPVVAFCRVGDNPIRTREPIATPDVVVIQDPTLLHQVPVFEGLRDGGTIIINTSRPLAALGLDDLAASHHVVTVAATALAREHIGRPLPGAPLLGALAALTGVVTVPALTGAIRERLTGRHAEGNIAAARTAYRIEVEHARAA